MSERKPSSFSGLNLDGIGNAPVERRPTADEIAQKTTAPSREAAPDKEGTEQMNMRLKISQFTRFTALCDRHRMSRPKMLDALMDKWEGR